MKNFDDVDRIQSVIGELNDDIANWDTNKANARKALQVAKGDLEKPKEVEVKTKEALEKATADFKAKSETVVQAQKAVDNYNASAEAVKQTQAEMKIIDNQIDELKACKESSNEKIDSLKEAKDNYVEKYNLYLDAKEELLKAESDYNETLRQLNAFLFEQNKENSPTKKDVVKTSSVNTGVSTNVEASVATAGLALAGIVLTETRRRKK